MQSAKMSALSKLACILFSTAAIAHAATKAYLLPSSPTTHPLKTASATATKSGSLAEIQTQAERGDPQAQAALGNMYYKGEGVAQDYAKALTRGRGQVLN
jgi:TPR repeat protein